MNILQTEDMVKGLPDELLMQQAQNPSGEIPQFLLVSEVQRRADMRKRFETENAEQPEGTVSEQILQQGIMGGQPPPQQGTGTPPPNMPQQLPTGQGIVPSQQQFPPMQDPNAPIAQGGMAGGGVVRMQTGGQFTFPQMGNQYTLAMGPNQTPQSAYEKGNYMPAEVQRGEQMVAPNVPSVSASSMGPAAGEKNVGNVDLGIESLPDETGLYEKASQAAYPEETWDSMFSSYGDYIKGIKEEPVNLVRHAKGAYDVWKQPAGAAWDSVKNAAGAVGTTAKELGRGVADEFGFDVGEGPFVRGGEGGSSVDRLRDLQARIDGTGEYAEEASGIGGITSEPETIEDLQRAQIAEEAALGEKNLAKFKGSEQHDKASGVQLQGRKGIENVIRKESVSDNTGIANLMKMAAAETDKVPGVKDLIEQQRKAAWSNALMQLGAGIAGGDMSEGLGNAAKAMSAGTGKAREMEMQSRLAQYGADRKDLDRKVDIYGKVGQLEVAEARAEADQLIQDGRNENEIMRSTMNYVNLMMAGSFSRGPEREEEVLRLLRNLMPASMIAKFGPALIAGAMDGGQQPSNAERPPLSSFN